MSAIPNLTCPICDNSEDDLLDPNKELEYRYYPQNRTEITTPFHKIMYFNCTKCLNKMLKNNNYKLPELIKKETIVQNALEKGVSRGSYECLKILDPYICISDIIKYKLIVKAIHNCASQTFELLLDCLIIYLKDGNQEDLPKDFNKDWNLLLVLAIWPNRRLCLKKILRCYAENEEIRHLVGHNFTIKLAYIVFLDNFINIILYMKKTFHFKDYNTTWIIIDNSGEHILNYESLSDRTKFNYLNNEIRTFLLQNLNPSITKPALRVQNS